MRNTFGPGLFEMFRRRIKDMRRLCCSDLDARRNGRADILSQDHCPGNSGLTDICLLKCRHTCMILHRDGTRCFPSILSTNMSVRLLRNRSLNRVCRHSSRHESPFRRDNLYIWFGLLYLDMYLPHKYCNFQWRLVRLNMCPLGIPHTVLWNEYRLR